MSTHSANVTKNKVMAGLALTCSLTTLPILADEPQMDGLRFVKEGKFAAALHCFKAALRDHPDSWQILQSIGNCQSELGDHESAVESLRQSIDTGGLHFDQCINLAAAYEKRGEFRAAISWLELACFVDPVQARRKQMSRTIAHLQSQNDSQVRPDATDSKTELKAAARWKSNSMPLRVFVQRDDQLPSFHKAFREIAERALNQWCVASNGKVSYKFVEAADAADIILEYGDEIQSKTKDDVLCVNATTDAQLRTKENAIIRARVRVFVDKVSAGSASQRGQISKLCLHEIGHALGLQGHSSDNKDVMFSDATASTVSEVLSEHDRYRIRWLYREGTYELRKTALPAAIPSQSKHWSGERSEESERDHQYDAATFTGLAPPGGGISGSSHRLYISTVSEYLISGVHKHEV